MDGFSLLEEAIRSMPVPGAPPRLSLDGAAVGLSFLDTALRLNHVRRLTERISLVDHRVARRITEVDVRLGMLDEGQRQASELFRSIAGHSPDGAEHPDGPAFVASEMWVPVARISRTAAPVDVRDASGRKLPRLTQYETSRLLASGLYRLLRGILTGFPDARRDEPLARLLYQDHEPRWLIQAALLALLTDRSRPTGPHPRELTPGMSAGHAADCRSKALKLLADYREPLGDYFALLDVAVNNYLLVVAMDRGADEHLLTYEAPLAVEKPRTRWSWSGTLRASSRGYLVQYEGAIPASLRSYHLVVETEPGVHIQKIYLRTDADQGLAGELGTDLKALATRLGPAAAPPRKSPYSKILELQTQTTLRRLADLLRRRQWDAEHARIAVPEQHLPGVAELGWAAISGEAVADGAALDNSLIRHPVVRPAKLGQAARELAAQELEYDLATEDNPTSNQASVYWRRRAVRSLDGAQIRTRAGILLRDATPSSPTTVLLYALSVALIAYSAATFAGHHFWPYWGAGAARLRASSASNSPGALIAVLLLVPGFLYSRLPLPDRHSVAGHLRALPRLVAHVCIGAMALLCAAVAADSARSVLPLAFGLATVVPLLAAIALVPPIRAAWSRRRDERQDAEELHLMGAPHWVDGRGTSQQRRRTPDAIFSSSGSLS